MQFVHTVIDRENFGCKDKINRGVHSSTLPIERRIDMFILLIDNIADQKAQRTESVYLG